MNGTVVIDSFPEGVGNYPREFAIVAIDVIRATTTAVTGVSMGRRCFPVDSLEAALELASKLHDPLLVGELGGDVPSGFDMNNSPVELALRIDISRPMILLSTSGDQAHLRRQ
jgi:2-phosphosulfolactate phosphatase